MKPDRITRVNELILRELGTQLYRVINRPDFNPAEVMFTKAETAVDLRTCRVGVSVRGTPAEQDRVLGILRHARALKHRHEQQPLRPEHARPYRRSRQIRKQP